MFLCGHGFYFSFLLEEEVASWKNKNSARHLVAEKTRCTTTITSMETSLHVWRFLWRYVMIINNFNLLAEFLSVCVNMETRATYRGCETTLAGNLYT